AVSELQLGTTLMMRNVENAGYHFPTSRYALTLRNNVIAGTISNGFGTPPVNVIARAPFSSIPYTAVQEGIPDTSDVVEVVQGTALGDNVQVSNPGTPFGSNRTVTFSTPMPGGSVLTYTAGQVGPALLFRSQTTECIGMVVGAGLPNVFTVTMLTQDFEPDP